MVLLEKTLQGHHVEVLAQKEMLWYQKSREKWVKFGNRNTKIFHAQAPIKRKRNKVSSLLFNGIWLMIKMFWGGKQSLTSRSFSRRIARVILLAWKGITFPELSKVLLRIYWSLLVLMKWRLLCSLWVLVQPLVLMASNLFFTELTGILWVMTFGRWYPRFLWRGILTLSWMRLSLSLSLKLTSALGLFWITL